jgi:hypothetical protein
MSENKIEIPNIVCVVKVNVKYIWSKNLSEKIMYDEIIVYSSEAEFEKDQANEFYQAKQYIQNKWNRQDNKILEIIIKDRDQAVFIPSN